MRDKLLGCFGIGAVVLLIISLIVNLFSFLMFKAGNLEAPATARRPTPFHEIELDPGGDTGGSDEEKIVQIDIEGLIFNVRAGGFGSQTMVDRLKRAFRQAGEDEDVAAVVLRINSPGGEVTASDILFNAVKELDGLKPVVVYMDSVAASGGYYIACGARKIVATPTTITGSIGVIMQAPNLTHLLDKVGVEMITFTSGVHKDSGSMFREMRVDEQVLFQEHIDETYARFVGIVAEARGIDEPQLRDGFADGRIFSGSRAAEVGLVDRVGYIEDAYELARELGGAENAPVVRYRSSSSFADFLGIFGEAQAARAKGAGTVSLDVSAGLWPRLEPGRVYLLPPSFVP